MTGVEYEVVEPPFAPDRVEAVLSLAREIFGKVNATRFEWRITHQPDPSLVLASDASGLVGFKFGFALVPERYRSALGGVVERTRRRGVARRMMELQHAWVAGRGYAAIETVTGDDNAAMLELNRQVGFEMIGSYDRDGARRIMMLKRLPTP